MSRSGLLLQLGECRLRVCEPANTCSTSHVGETTMKDFWKKLGEPWEAFAVAVLNPAFLCVAALAVVLAVMQSGQAAGCTMDTALLVLLGLSSGLAGAVLDRRYTEFSGQRVIVARGKTAIRALSLLVREIQALEDRVANYRHRHDRESYDGEISPEVVKTYLEEVGLKCISLQEQGLSSIENWKDIIPEADVPKQVGIVTELKAQLAEERAERAALVEDLEATKARLAEGEVAKQEVRKLRKEIASKDRRIGSLTKDISEADPFSVGTLALTSPGISGSQYSGGSVCWSGSLGDEPSWGFQWRNCPHCGELLLGEGNFCPQCGKELPD
jgi:hypothetical protein